jgi:D-cysteine desulfhydrase
MIHPNEPARLPLAMLPTPVVELKNLAKSLGVSRLLMKRDDLTGLELSGNKIRKLEYLIADAIAQGCDTLVTHGGYQSNHCRATAAAGARVGMKVRLILRAPDGDPGNDGNLLLDRLFGAQISFHSTADYNARTKELIDAAMAEERAAGRKPYCFPVGASVPLGCWGYIRMMAELAEQLGRDSKVDVFAAVSSSGTFAGMVLGKALLGLDNWHVAGIPVSDSLQFFRKEVGELISATNTKFGLGLKPEQTPIDLIDGYIGQGYAIPFPAALETVKQLGRMEGILLDPTYTAKAMAGFLDQVKSNATRDGALPVFVHTGGIFGLMARRDLFA